MQIRYSEHIKGRLTLRKIEYDLPRKIFEKSEERYFDAKTGHTIAVMKVELYKKIREVMVAYVYMKHPVKKAHNYPLRY